LEGADVWETLTTPDILSNVLDALSFVLITPEVIGHERLGRLVDAVGRRIEDTMAGPEFPVGVISLGAGAISFVGFAAVLVMSGLQSWIGLDLLPALTAERLSTYLVMFIAALLLSWLLPILLLGVFFLITFVTHRRATLGALFLGIGCFFTARVVAIVGALQPG
jgi:hypothetical protein